MSNIFVEGVPVRPGDSQSTFSVAGHFYLVYIDDNGNEFTINGQPQFRDKNNPSDFNRRLTVNIGIPLSQGDSRNIKLGETQKTRDARRLNLGVTVTVAITPKLSSRYRHLKGSLTR